MLVQTSILSILCRNKNGSSRVRSLILLCFAFHLQVQLLFKLTKDALEEKVKQVLTNPFSTLVTKQFSTIRFAASHVARLSGWNGKCNLRNFQDFQCL